MNHVLKIESAVYEGSHDSEINPFMNETTIVALVALLSAVIVIVGLVSIVPWHYIWRTNRSQTANLGLKKKFIESLPWVKYRKVSSELEDVAAEVECSICLTEFMEGDKMRVLPTCKHSFHVECVDQWLGSHSSCPICRHCLLQREDERKEKWVAREGSVIVNDIECGVTD